MKFLLALALIGFSLSACNPNGSRSNSNGGANAGNNSNNTNNGNNSNSTKVEPSPKEKFIGTWEHPPADEVGLLTMTINPDDTFVIQLNHVGDENAKTTKGKYTVREDRLFMDGEVGKDVKDGFVIEGGRLKGVADNGKQTLYFNKK